MAEATLRNNGENGKGFDFLMGLAMMQASLDGEEENMDFRPVGRNAASRNRNRRKDETGIRGTGITKTGPGFGPVLFLNFLWGTN